jgi:hypothetical protein
MIKYYLDELRVLRMIQIPTLDQTENPHDALTTARTRTTTMKTNMLYCIALVLYCIVLYCNVLCCIVLFSIKQRITC